MHQRFRKLFFTAIIILSGAVIFAQEFTGTSAGNIIPGASKVWLKEGMQIPSYIAFAPGNEIPEEDIVLWLRKQFTFDETYDLEYLSEEVDFRGDRHIRVKLSYKGHPLFDAMLILHVAKGSVYAINGDLPSVLHIANNLTISESAALQLALQHVNATRYKWQMPEEEAMLKSHTDDPQATYYPKGRIELYRPDTYQPYRYVYTFNIYADQPLYRADIFVDAATGEILFEHNRIYVTDVTGTAVTKYSATQSITTDSTGITYRLRETGRGNGIETYNMQKGTSYGAAVDFTDGDNYWNNFNTNKDEVATDAHWGTEMTYDYYYTKFNRNSIDNLGFKLRSYVHYDDNYVNAFWDGQRMTYGDGNGTSIGPLTAIDIAAHEITHGLTSYTADLVYQDESGALNEAFSDIFGTAVEWYAKPASANWTMGENIGTTLRSISNPKSKGLPSTYSGTYWYTGTGDNGGVHTNCGPYSYWFYLLAAGGSGTNDIGHSFNVTGISIDSAAAIAFRTLTVYLTNSSQYVDARYYSIQSAIDLFGPCSQQVASTTDALYAIGVGGAYVPGVISDFSAPLTEYCAAPATVSFVNNSNNGLSYQWDFGDGQTSTLLNPTHTYTSMGHYTVTLIVDGGSCGSDTLIKTNYISIDLQNPCISNMPQNGTLTHTNCSGFLYDSGGNQNYHNNTDGVFIISPSGAMSVTLTFQSFSFEAGYDYLYIYDGAGITAPLIGQYSGSTLPNSGTITSTGSSITLRQSTDQYLTESGFLLGWNCNYPTTAPVADFIVSDTVTCDGEVTFLDVSTNGPSAWYWELGDGTTASTKIVNHTYQQDGLYSIKLATSNMFGSDTIFKHGLIRVELAFPDIAPAALCDSGTLTLNNPDTSYVTRWYDDSLSQTPLYTGSSFNTSMLTQNTTYWVEEIIEKPVFSGGKPSNAGSGSYFTAAVEHYLVFNAFKPVILHSVVVYAGSAGNRMIELQNSSGTVIQSKSVSLTQGMNIVELEFDIPVANGLRLVGPSSPNLFRNDGGISFPYNIQDLISITHSSASSNPTGYYYFFYMWKVSEYPCVSSKVPVTVLVSQMPPTADFTFTQLDPVVNFTDMTVNPGINLWNFGDGSTASGTNPVHQYGAVGTYPVKLTVDNGCGIDSIIKSVYILSMAVPEVTSFSEQLRIYPNPSDGQFTIILPQELTDRPYQLEMRDVMGRKQVFTVLSSHGDHLTLSAQVKTTGIYLITLQGAGKNYKVRMIIL